MTLEIPGYYYDEEKKRYFKIEDNRTAPAEASWSSGNVKRRKIESKEAEMKREREARNAGRVKKAVEVWGEPLLGGCFFGREIGLGLGSSLGATERRRGEVMGDLRRESWTMGLREKGTLRLWPERNNRHGDVTYMYVGGEEVGGNSGLGAAYAVANFTDLRSRYIPRDDQDEINFGDTAVRYPRIDLSPRRESAHMPTLSSIHYHAPSHKMLLTSGHRNDGAAIAYFSLGLAGVDAGEGQPAWRLGELTPLIQIRAASPSTNRYASTINTLRPAPASSPLTAVAGTNSGVLKLQGDNLTWLDWSPPESTRLRDRRAAEIFSVDFVAQNPAHLVLAAGRSSDIAVIDTRLQQHSGAVSYIRHTSSVAHVRSVGDYGVLAAGPKSAMAIYDIRFSSHDTGCHPEPHSGKKQHNRVQPLPVVTFPEYKNEAHVLSVGFDVSDSKAGGLGIVAAAQDDGTVGLFSLASGKKLRSKVVGSIGVGPSVLDPPQRYGAMDVVAVRMIKSMMFQTLSGDTHPSLFVGEGLGIRKFSFGVSYSKKGGCFVEEED